MAHGFDHRHADRAQLIGLVAARQSIIPAMPHMDLTGLSQGAALYRQIRGGSRQLRVCALTAAWPPFELEFEPATMQPFLIMPAFMLSAPL